MPMNPLPDSGQRQTFESGSVRDTNEGKGDFSLLPAKAIARLARHFQMGAAKYKKANWRLGQPLSRYADSALRHTFQFLDGEDKTQDHLISAIWNLMCLAETQELIEKGLLPKELNDLHEIQTKYPENKEVKLDGVILSDKK